MLNENAVEMSAKQLAQNRRFALIVWFMFVGLVKRDKAIYVQLKLKNLGLSTKLNCGNLAIKKPLTLAKPYSLDCFY
jgi:hypothetical protein